jgi:DNA-binding transcriptional regulator YdaS (Cro superfamily)
MIDCQEIFDKSSLTGLSAVFEALGGRGGQEKLARMLGISSAAISRWKAVPAHRIVQIEALTGVPREIQRPELYR